jgi:hypothetical protein
MKGDYLLECCFVVFPALLVFLSPFQCSEMFLTPFLSGEAYFKLYSLKGLGFVHTVRFFNIVCNV